MSEKHEDIWEAFDRILKQYPDDIFKELETDVGQLLHLNEVEIKDLKSEIASLKQQLSEAAKREEEAFKAATLCDENKPRSDDDIIRMCDKFYPQYEAYADYLKTKKAEAIVNKNIEGFKYLADKEQKE